MPPGVIFTFPLNLVKGEEISRSIPFPIGMGETMLQGMPFVPNLNFASCKAVPS